MDGSTLFPGRDHQLNNHLREVGAAIRSLEAGL